MDKSADRVTRNAGESTPPVDVVIVDADGGIPEEYVAARFGDGPYSPNTIIAREAANLESSIAADDFLNIHTASVNILTGVSGYVFLLGKMYYYNFQLNFSSNNF